MWRPAPPPNCYIVLKVNTVSSLRLRVRKGISPVIATILMIIIAIAASFIVWHMVTAASKPRAVVKLDVVTADAAIPPSGSEASITLVMRNSGNVRLTIDNITVSYQGKTYTETLGRDIVPGGTFQYGFTVTASGIGVAQFVDGDTLKLTINYHDPQGNHYSITKYVSLHT